MVTAQKTTEGEAIITVEEMATTVEEADFSIDNFVSSFKCISVCQDVDLEDAEKWLVAEKELQPEALSDDEIIDAVADVTQDNDDSDIDDPKAILMIPHTGGAKALEMVLCYVEQQASAFSIDEMLKKMAKLCINSSNFQSSAEKKPLIFYKLSSYWYVKLM